MNVRERTCKGFALFPYRLAAVDLDDTLLGPDKKISEANAEAIAELRRRGVRVVLASGRRHENMIRFHRLLDLDGPIVSCNGAFAQDAETGEVLHEHLVPPDLAAEVIAEGTRQNATLNFYHPNGELYVRERTQWTDLYQRRTGSDLVVFGDLAPLSGVSPQKIIWLDDGARVAGLLPEMEARYAGRLYITVTDPEYLEFMAHGVSKAEGVAAIARHYHIDQSEVLAFGDGNNDVPLLEWAGLSVAMSDGRDSAKAAANHVSPPGHPETSFARAVTEILEIHTNK